MKRIVKKLLLSFLLLVTVGDFVAFSQNFLNRKAEKVVTQQDYTEIFRSIETGFSQGNVVSFSKYFAPQVYVNLPGEDGGYYSANQAYYILQNYLGSRQPQSFHFSTYGELENIPYATGPGRFTIKGSVETVQVYIALSRVNNQWVVSQINIY